MIRLMAISPVKARTQRRSSRGSGKPRIQGVWAKTKLLRIDEADLKMIERAARSLDPPPSSSYFILQAAIARAAKLLAS